MKTFFKQHNYACVFYIVCWNTWRKSGDMHAYNLTLNNSTKTFLNKYGFKENIDYNTQHRFPLLHQRGI